MADEPKFTQADIDKAVAAAVEKADVDGLKKKIDELMDEAKDAKRKLRAASEIKPEDLTAAEERAEKAEAKVKELEKSVTALTKERDTAVKNLETEQGAARTYALDAEINAAIAAGQVVPALVPAFTALLKQTAKAELVDGKYAVSIGDKPAKEHIETFLASEDGKHYKAANANSGGGANGGGSKTAAKTMTRAAYDALDPQAKATAGMEAAKGELSIVDAA